MCSNYSGWWTETPQAFNCLVGVCTSGHIAVFKQLVDLWWYVFDLLSLFYSILAAFSLSLVLVFSQLKPSIFVVYSRTFHVLTRDRLGGTDNCELKSWISSTWITVKEFHFHGSITELPMSHCLTKMFSWYSTAKRALVSRDRVNNFLHSTSHEKNLSDARYSDYKPIHYIILAEAGFYGLMQRNYFLCSSQLPECSSISTSWKENLWVFEGLKLPITTHVAT